MLLLGEVRDSKDPGGPVLVFTAPEWTAFIAGAREGEFDVDILTTTFTHTPPPI